MLLAAVERGGRVHVQPLATHSRDAIETALDGMLAPGAVAMTDGLPACRHFGAERTHLAVNHSRHEYARTDGDTGLRVHVNTAEGFNATMKRAVVGVFRWISRKHLVRYACETSFRWNRRTAEAPERLREMLRLACRRRLPYATLIGATG